MRKRYPFRSGLFTLALAAATPLVHAQSFEVLHEFNGATDGANPEGALLLDQDGNLYGQSFAGGIGEGTVYKIDSTGNETILFTFDAFVSGAVPASALIRDDAGNLYGIADEGPGGAGIVYALSPTGEQTLLHAFQGGLTNRNPKVPTGGIRMDAAGNIYGTTLFGGQGLCQSGCGTIFSLDTAGTLHVLYSFAGGVDGSQPFGPLVADKNGNLYGVTQSGGDLTCAEAPQAGCGTVFKLSRNRQLTVLHTFAGGADGAMPQPGLLLDDSGRLFGTASRGGTAENGIVFRIAPHGTYTVVHRFTGMDGSTPNGSLVRDDVGNLYGTAQSGGTRGLGTVYKMSPGGRVTVLHSFTGDLDGAFPLAGVIRDSTGHLFGTAVKNFLVNQQNGVAFEIRP
jgi:uncharacterized repeat protein (TIGR03803 family)